MNEGEQTSGARGHGRRVEVIKDLLRARLREGVHRPGDRFPPARELAATYGISYQTAHRVTTELVEEGLLERRPTVGTFIAGIQPFTRIVVCLDARGRRPESFGARLLEELSRRFERLRAPWDVAWLDEGNAAAPLGASDFPVLWEAPSALAACISRRHPALLLNDRPAPGLSATLIDSVSVDDYSGGAAAAQLLLRRVSAPDAARLCVVSGPDTDPRSVARRDGFLSAARGASVISAGGWYYEDAARIADGALSAGRDGIFCGNDRLAQAVLARAAEEGMPRPRIVGFDNAPVAGRLDLTTIAIPWEEMAAAAAEILERRLAGDASMARQVIITPRPIVRTL